MRDERIAMLCDIASAEREIYCDANGLVDAHRGGVEMFACACVKCDYLRAICRRARGS